MSETIKRLDLIAESICDYFENNEIKVLSPGLYSGNLGLLIFLAYYAKYIKNARAELSFQINFAKYLDTLSDYPHFHSFCDGISGAFCGIKHLNNNNFVEVDMAEVEEMLKSYLLASLNKDINKGYYDFMHGALGVGFYSLYSNTDIGAHELIIKFLESTKVENKNVIKWGSIVDIENNKTGFNISLSHGMASIVMYLSKLFSQDLYASRVQYLIEGAVAYMQEQEINRTQFGSCFPYVSKEDDKTITGSRLAWCYGDLGVGLALFHAAKALDRSDWLEHALDILKFNASRRGLKSNYMFDGCICHGTAGVAQIFRRLFYATNDETFLTASNYWASETLKQASFEDGLAGFMTFYDQRWIKDYSLLEGISGIGLSLIASEYDIESSAWDELFFIS